MKPHAKRPQRGRLIRPRRIKIGAWREQTVDALVNRIGLNWYRVANGLGGRGDREDWIADVPKTLLSVHDYQWNGDSFGSNHGSFNGAVAEETKRALLSAELELSKIVQQAREIRTSIAILKKAVSAIPNKSKSAHDQNHGHCADCAYAPEN